MNTKTMSERFAPQPQDLHRALLFATHVGANDGPGQLAALEPVKGDPVAGMRFTVALAQTVVRTVAQLVPDEDPVEYLRGATTAGAAILAEDEEDNA
ncbi:hypothetical protein ACFQ80_19100 [Isoptericola sp. NPDC056578]|uniref:hypothetical protein n=1 Tax=Isoptericola sp. NPDC056578 TaxID=3345870 RepID=UPI0036C53862